jgi:predicted RNA polymerase sigma factor
VSSHLHRCSDKSAHRSWALNRAIAVAETEGPAAGLALVATITDELDGYYLLHAARGSLLARLGFLPSL